MSGFSFGFNIKVTDEMMKQAQSMSVNVKSTEVPVSQPQRQTNPFDKKDGINVSTNSSKVISNASSVNFGGYSDSSSSTQTQQTTIQDTNSNVTIKSTQSHSESVTTSYGGGFPVGRIGYAEEQLPSHRAEINSAGNLSFDSDKVNALKNISQKNLSAEDQKLLIDVTFSKINFDSSIMDVLRSASNNRTFNEQGKEYLFDKVNSSRLFSSSKSEVFKLF